MRINEILLESEQLDEGPFTQAIGKGAGKVARGIANIGKDLKTGFKAGYSGEQPPADPAVTAKTKPVAKPAVDNTKSGGGVIDQFKKSFNQGRGNADATTSVDADPQAEKQSKIGVGQINKIIPTLRTRDLLSLQANLEKIIADRNSKKQKTTTATNTDQTGGAGAFGQMATQLSKAGENPAANV